MIGRFPNGSAKLTNHSFLDLQFVSEMLEGGTFVRDYGSRQETVNLDDARGIGL